MSGVKTAASDEDARAAAAPPLGQTPSQTAGPYLHIGCLPSASGVRPACRLDPGARALDGGEPIAIGGRVFDGAGEALGDALIECWQADARGRYREGGWTRRALDAASGEWRLDTVRPGSVRTLDGRGQAPHVALWIVARGINVGLHTRLYFEGDPANVRDPLLASLPPERARTLLARHDGALWRLDIHLQGDHETVFLDV